MASKMAFYTGFGPRRAAGLAEQPKFLFEIVIWHLNEHFVRVSALNSKIFLISTPFRVVPTGDSGRILCYMAFGLYDCNSLIVAAR